MTAAISGGLGAPPPNATATTEAAAAVDARTLALKMRETLVTLACLEAATAVAAVDAGRLLLAARARSSDDASWLGSVRAAAGTIGVPAARAIDVAADVIRAAREEDARRV